MRSVSTLIQGSIDYAGLFPPAGLDMRSAVRNYAEYRAGSHGAALGRFVVPVGRLAEFEEAAEAFLPRRPGGPAWTASALAGADLADDIKRLGEFNCRHAADGAGAVSADVVELKAGTVPEIDAALAPMPSYLTAYVEIPIGADPAELLGAIARRGGRAKVRTGGVTADAFPGAAELIRFVRRCAEAGVPFKATAGLHHPLRAEYRLTYDAGSASAPMHGFVNLFLAAAFVFAGMGDDDATALLEERAPSAFRVDDDGIEWRNHRLGLDALANARERAIIAFGSCSFTEPIDDLTALGWL